MKKMIASKAMCLALLIQVLLPNGMILNGNNIPIFISRYSVEAAQFEYLEAQELFHEAYTFYITARPMTPLGEGSKPYAEAIRAISQAVSMEPENVDYLLLASQIYRGKGGISFAKEYFTRAETILLKELHARPDSIDANLDYAILCCAGDVRYWPNYDSYNKKAQQHADRVLSLYKKENGNKDSRLSLYAALAYLVKGDDRNCEKLLISGKSPDTRFYFTLYQDTVKKNRWAWPTKNAGKEFLLYYMTDTSRHKRL